MNFIRKIFVTISIICLVSSSAIAQDKDITEYLVKIENGFAQEIKKDLTELLRKYPSDPSILFLDAVLTDNGFSAYQKYEKIYNDYPQSKYADASLFRIFSYFYSFGYYKRAEETLSKLQEEYPDSPYIRPADRSFPDESSEIDENSLSDKKFVIQAGAFVNLKNAKNLKQKLIDEGFKVNLTTKEVAGTSLNLVLVGNYETEQEAIASLEILKTKYKIDGRILPPR